MATRRDERKALDPWDSEAQRLVSPPPARVSRPMTWGPGGEEGLAKRDEPHRVTL